MVMRPVPPEELEELEELLDVPKATRSEDSGLLEPPRLVRAVNGSLLPVKPLSALVSWEVEVPEFSRPPRTEFRPVSSGVSAPPAPAS